MHFFAFLLFFTIGIALLGMLLLLVLNIIMVFKALKGDHVVFIKSDDKNQNSDKAVNDLKSSIERQRNDDWLRAHNKTT